MAVASNSASDLGIFLLKDLCCLTKNSIAFL